MKGEKLQDISKAGSYKTDMLTCWTEPETENVQWNESVNKLQAKIP